jgi:hypothetical protein
MRVVDISVDTAAQVNEIRAERDKVYPTLRNTVDLQSDSLDRLISQPSEGLDQMMPNRKQSKVNVVLRSSKQ